MTPALRLTVAGLAGAGALTAAAAIVHGLTLAGASPALVTAAALGVLGAGVGAVDRGAARRVAADARRMISTVGPALRPVERAPLNPTLPLPPVTPAERLRSPHTPREAYTLVRSAT